MTWSRCVPASSATWTGIITTNPVMRVTANFLIRVNKVKKQRLFSKEAEAVQWLEERIKEDQAHA